MSKINYVTDDNGNEHVIIDNDNGSYTSMLKSTYDTMQTEQSTPIVIDETPTQ
jgi:hypothetical protein